MTNEHRFLVNLSDIRYVKDGVEREVAVDGLGMMGVQKVYVNDRKLGRALARHGAHAVRAEVFRRESATMMMTDQLIIGVSGYASECPRDDQDYVAEAEAMLTLYEQLLVRRTPTLITDGGGAEGILGINGFLAQAFDLRAAGAIPIQGLHSFGARNELMVWGETFRDREVIVATLPDILICVGGGPGTRRECEIALEHGGVVILLNVKDYGPDSFASTFSQYEAMQEAGDRLVVCRSAEPSAIVEALDKAFVQREIVRTDNVLARLSMLDMQFASPSLVPHL